MATSGAYAFSVNRDQIVRLAMLNIGKLEQNEVPTPEEMTDCVMFLNMLVKQWQGTTDFAPGLKTWTRRHGHLFLHNNTGQYQLGPNAVGWTLNYLTTTTSAAAAAGQPVVFLTSVAGVTAGDHFGVKNSNGDISWLIVLSVGVNFVTLTTNLPISVGASAVAFTYTTTATQPVKIETAFLRDYQLNDTPLVPITSSQYDSLPSKVTPTNISDPVAYYYEFQLINGVLFLDVAGVQDVSRHIGITYLEAEQDFVNPNDTPEYPQEWYLALALGLSKLIAPMFNAPWSQVMEENARLALIIAQKKEPECSVAYFRSGEDMFP